MRIKDKSVTKISVVEISDGKGKKTQPGVIMLVEVPVGMCGTEILLTKNELKRLYNACI